MKVLQKPLLFYIVYIFSASGAWKIKSPNFLYLHSSAQHAKCLMLKRNEVRVKQGWFVHPAWSLLDPSIYNTLSVLIKINIIVFEPTTFNLLPTCTPQKSKLSCSSCLNIRFHLKNFQCSLNLDYFKSCWVWTASSPVVKSCHSNIDRWVWQSQKTPMRNNTRSQKMQVTLNNFCSCTFFGRTWWRHAYLNLNGFWC